MLTLSNIHFRLQTLYCDEALDLSRIIRSQTELQILGIYEYDDSEVGFLGTLKRLQNAQLHLPVVVTLKCGYYEYFQGITIFPAFYSIKRLPTIYQVLAESFNKNQSYYVLADAGKVLALSIYLVDACDLPSIQVLTRNMSMTFPEIGDLTFCFENQCEIVSSLSTMIELELKSIRMNSAVAGDEKNHRFIPLPERAVL